MAGVLTGFEEIRLSKAVGKVTMTVTEAGVRFNKATAVALGYPAWVRVLVNRESGLIAVQATTAKANNAIHFSKPEGKQAGSINVREAGVLEAALSFMPLEAAPEGEVAFKAVDGEVHANEKVVIFDSANVTAGTMKRRGRRKTA